MCRRPLTLPEGSQGSRKTAFWKYVSTCACPSPVFTSSSGWLEEREEEKRNKWFNIFLWGKKTKPICPGSSDNVWIFYSNGIPNAPKYSHIAGLYRTQCMASSGVVLAIERKWVGKEALFFKKKLTDPGSPQKFILKRFPLKCFFFPPEVFLKTSVRSRNDKSPEVFRPTSLPWRQWL